MITDDLAKTLISLVDLTSLNADDDTSRIEHLCQQAETPYQSVAAVCVYPAFVKTAAQRLADKEIGIATVANFPTGAEHPMAVLETVKKSLDDGATEIDLVFPYTQYLQGDKQTALHLVEEVKAICGSRLLKVILETGELPSQAWVAEIATDVLKSGADFLKTSTGKTPHGASLDAAETLLKVIKEHQGQGYTCGLKISGGVREAQQASEYYQLAVRELGASWPTKIHFRIGASSLLTNLVNLLGQKNKA